MSTATSTATEFDPAKVEAMGGKLMGYLNSSMAAMSVSIGHQTGLFDCMAKLPASTSQQIADAAGLNERYVREWLGCLTLAGVVEYDMNAKTYRLPPEHAALTTRAALNNNFAAFFTFIGMAGSVEEKIIDCFRNGGGVPYSAYPDFSGKMAACSGPIFDVTLVPSVFPLVPGLNERLKAGIDVADLGAGSGHAINVMARAFPNSRFTGYDFGPEGVAKGTAEAKAMGLTNARFEVADIPKMRRDPNFDLITTFDAIHDQADPAGFLAVARGCLRPGGVYLASDVAASSELGENYNHPLGPFFYGISLMHCMTVSLHYNGAGLGAAWGTQKALQMLNEAGFASVEVKQVEGDVLNNYYICKA
jgi:2-polyprenyl-3-methyl-5-hydroxy-6-metoxy-1,4-benzoquinol methylase